MTDEIATIQSVERLKILFETHSQRDEDYLTHSISLKVEEWSGKYLYKRLKDEEMNVLDRNNRPLKLLGDTGISRKQVFDIFKDVSTGEATLEEVFVAVMAWGFKPKSYGPYRTSVMLSKPRKNRIVRDILESVAGENDPIAAYGKLANTLEGLGPAFGTKFLYFTSVEGNRAPILDAVVANWLGRYGVRDVKGKWITPVGWNPKLYERYVQFCTEICEILDISDRGLVEYLMFIDAQYSDYLEQGKAQPLWITSAVPLGWPVNKTT